MYSVRCRKGVWSDVQIPLHRFLLTWKGKLVETKSEINARSVISIGISLAGSDRGTAASPGEFSLGLESIKAQRLSLDEPRQERI